MDLYSRMRNIYGKNNEEELVKSIVSVKEQLEGLTEERMCKVYSSFLLRELNNRHVPARLVNTLDLGLEYEHLFVLVPSNDNGYFLADLTFSQFNENKDSLKSLIDNGYQLVDDVIFDDYFDAIGKGNINNEVTVSDVFYSNRR